MKTGLVLGRFQPLHLGHISLLKQALEENDELVICIGSAQLADPLLIEERKRRIEEQMKLLPKKNYRIVCLNDLEERSKWPMYLKHSCALEGKEVIIYRADTDKITTHLKELHFEIRIIKRFLFPYKGPDGIYYEFSSAREIRELHTKTQTMHLI